MDVVCQAAMSRGIVYGRVAPREILKFKSSGRGLLSRLEDRPHVHFAAIEL